MTTTTDQADASYTAAFSEALRLRIAADGRSKAAIAAAAGITRMTLHNYLVGRYPGVSELAAVERALGLKPFTLAADAKKLFVKS